MKNKHNGGFSLIETLVAIAVLGIVVVPTCNAMLTSFRLNQAADTMLQSQLAVSSAVETMMAQGIHEQYVPTAGDSTENGENYGWYDGSDNFSDVTIIISKGNDDCEHCKDNDDSSFYEVTATSTANTSVSVTTHIRAASSEAPPPEETVAVPLGGS